MRSKHRKKQEKKRLAKGLFLIAIALHLLACKWSSSYFTSSPTAIIGIENSVGVYSRRSHRDGLMLGVLVPTALICVGTFVTMED